MSVHDRRGARVLDRRAGPWRNSPRPPSISIRRTRSSCRRCSAESAAAPSRSSSVAACRRASGRACARLFRKASFPAPVKYGYASVGRVECGPSDLTGRIVFALHPHQTRYVVPASAVHVVPIDVPPERAVLAANLETALNGIWDARLHVGDRVVVIGGGTVGCLVAWLAARIAGLRRAARRSKRASCRSGEGARRFVCRSGRRHARRRRGHSRERLARRPAARAGRCGR